MPHLPEPLRHQHGGPLATLFARGYLAPYGSRSRPDPLRKRTSGLRPYGSALALGSLPPHPVPVGSQSLDLGRPQPLQHHRMVYYGESYQKGFGEKLGPMGIVPEQKIVLTWERKHPFKGGLNNTRKS